MPQINLHPGFNDFAFRLMRADGAVFAGVVRRDNPLYGEALNLMGGAEPYRWIGSGSLNKVVRIDDGLRRQMTEILNRLADTDEARDKTCEFFAGIRPDGLIAYLRESVIHPVRDALMQEAYRQLQGCELGDLYDVYVFGDGKDRQFTGPDDYRKCVCRFCHRTYPEVRFDRKNAHAIPDALGNKLVFCNDECTTCNHDLAEVENNLINYFNYRRAEDKIPGKRGRIKTIYGQNYCVEGATGHVEISPDAIVADDGVSLTVKNLDARLISHLGIYRALSKIAIDLLPGGCLADFAVTVDWIRGAVAPHTVPNVYFAYRQDKVIQPVARVYVRKSGIGPAQTPHSVVTLDIDDLRFFFLVPFAKSDGTEWIRQDALDALMHMFISDGDIGYDRIDMSDRAGKYAHVYKKITAADANIVPASKFDSAREKSPNNIDFPPLDCRRVSVLSSELVEFIPNRDRNVPAVACIEHSSLNVHTHNMVYGDAPGVFTLALSFSVSDIVTGAEIFRAILLVNARHSRPAEICSLALNEISHEFTRFLTDRAIETLSTRASALMPHFNFSALPQLIEENTLYDLPDDKAGK